MGNRIGTITVTLLVLTLAMVFSGAHALAAERLAVSSPVANIRSGPGTKHDIIWKVEQYHPVVIVKKSGKWYKFKDFENDEGWIHSSLLKKITAVITTKDKCNVRTGPGMKNPIAFTVERGIPFKVLRRKGEWLHIEHSDGDRGWIHKSLVW
jgi:SH3-like domain-containing protein